MPAACRQTESPEPCSFITTTTGRCAPAAPSAAAAAVQHDGVRLELTVQPFTDLRTITESVGTAMHVAGSQSRRDELARLLGEELEFLPRAREDVDAVVALIDNTEANALVPALRFHFASDLPVYASSQTTRAVRVRAV